MHKIVGYFYATILRGRLVARSLTATAFVYLMTVFAPPSHAALTCTASMQDMAFGAVDVTPGTAIDITAILQVVCTGNSSGRMCINFNASTGGSWSDDATSRKIPMGASNTIRYNLYTDAARTTLWGSWADGYQTSGLQYDMTAGTYNIPVYARLLGSQQSSALGTYTTTYSGKPAIVYTDRIHANCPTPGSGIFNTTASFTALTTVMPSCTLQLANINFGSKLNLSANSDATGTVTVNCSNTAPYTLSIGNGNTGTSPTNRKMVKGSSSITYGMYKDAARTSPWGSTVGTNTVGGTGTGSSQSYTVYGRAPIQTTPPVGTYTDSVVVTVTY